MLKDKHFELNADETDQLHDTVPTTQCVKNRAFSTSLDDCTYQTRRDVDEAASIAWVDSRGCTDMC